MDDNYYTTGISIFCYMVLRLVDCKSGSNGNEEEAPYLLELPNRGVITRCCRTQYIPFGLDSYRSVGSAYFKPHRQGECILEFMAF